MTSYDGIASIHEDDRGFVIGYMDRTDFEYELGAASGGDTVYPSLDDVLAHRKCANECGVVEVEVRFRKLVKEGTSEH